MKIDVAKISKAKGARLPIDLDADLKTLDLNGELIKFTEPIHIKGEIVNENDVLALTGQMEVIGTRQCGRCLESFGFTLNIPVEEKYVRDTDVEDAEDNVVEENHKVYSANTIDVDSLIEELLVLELPIQGLCKADCRGLCERCGINKNTDQCLCYVESVDPRMQALQKFFTKE